MILSKGEKKLVSVILPSRKRFNMLLKSLRSVYETAANASQLETIIRFDDDDKESIKRIPELPFTKMNLRVIIGPRLRGYFDLNKFINECCGVSRGEFLFLFNDDSTIVTEHWDKELEKYKGEIVVLNPDTNDDAQQYNTFPIVSRGIYELVGHFSLQAHSDAWVSHIGKKLNIEKHVNIEIFHDRPDNPNFTGTKEKILEDITWKERSDTFPKSAKEFFSQKFQQLIQEDVLNIYTNLLKKGL